MGRKTIILREDQFNEICGTNTAYLDNNNDYAEDGTVTTKAAGAVSDSNGEKEYSEPITGKEWGHEMAPETLFALLFRNGGHGLWGHWGSGLRAKELTEEIGKTKQFNLGPGDEICDYELFENGNANYYFTTEEPLSNNASTMEEFFERINETGQDIMWDYDGSQAFAKRGDGMEIQLDAGGNGDFINHIVTVTVVSGGKVNESNSELEGRSWNGNSYTNLTTKKTELKQQLNALVRQNAPEKQIQSVKSAYAAICRILDRETGAIKGRKTAMKNLGFNNQFQKAGGKKNSGNGKAHSKKTKDPNVGTGFITYTE
jgi:hypothetical protein